MLIPLKTLLEKYSIKPTGILHIGASTGQEAEDYHNAGIANIIWIEAIPYVYQDLLKTIEKYPRNIAFNKCIGDVDGKQVKFNIANHGAQSSSMLELGTHKQAHPEVKYVSSFAAYTTRIDSLLNDYGFSIAQYDFLNIDLQGAELLALKGMGEELHKANYAYLEVNKAELYIGCPLIEDIDYYMEQFDFKRVETEWAGNTNWGDAFYIKNKAL